MGSKSLQEWLDWQSTLHPSEIELGLERIKTVWKRLHPGSLSCKVITVAGTNGKGSCVAFLDAILRAGGYRTGCYPSPHLVRYNERIRIDGAEADDGRLCQAFERIDQARGNSTLTYFEFGTLAALEIFAGSNLDVAILEVGLGGRLDGVNIIDSDVALITTVDIDHTDWLGNTRDEIGLEKAGIMRSGCPVVPIAILRNDDRSHTLHVGKAMSPRGMTDTEEDIKEFTGQISKAVERFIWDRPEQWFWVHRRWKGAAEARGSR